MSMAPSATAIIIVIMIIIMTRDHEVSCNDDNNDIFFRLKLCTYSQFDFLLDRYF